MDGIIPALQAGKVRCNRRVDVDHAGTTEKVDFTHKYYNTPSALAAPKDTTLKA